MEVSGQIYGPAALPQEMSPCYPLYRGLGGPQSRSGGGGEEKNSQPKQYMISTLIMDNKLSQMRVCEKLVLGSNT
jgi:hypothetical protein